MTRSPALALVALLLFAGSAAVATAEDSGLAAGIRLVDEGDFEGAVAALGPVADRLSATGGRDAAQACLYLGIAHLALDQRDAARTRFGQALGHDPSFRLAPDRFSPKVLAAFEEARRERETATREAEAARSEPAGGGGSRKLLLGAAAAAVGGGILYAVGKGDTNPPPGIVSFSGARFGTPVLECPDGTVAAPLLVTIDLSAENDTGRDVTISAVSAVLIIVSSPAGPSEVGTASSQPATVAPSLLRPGRTGLRVQTTLTCGNGSGDASRFNEWKGRVTLTAVDAQTVETADTMRVNIP